VTEFLLLRHGESTWNAEHRWQGQSDPPLTRRGEQQARDAVASLVELGPFDAVVASNLQRARRTGELLAQGASLELGPAVAALAERYASAWEGLTADEIELRYPGYLAAGRRPDGYEGDGEVVERVCRAIASLAERHPGGRVLVVSHGGVIGALEQMDAAGEGEPTGHRTGNLEGRWLAADPAGVRIVGDHVRLLLAGDDHAEPGAGTGEYV
jgi:broad specificity phosphatase PhoE